MPDEVGQLLLAVLFVVVTAPLFVYVIDKETR